MKQTKKKHFKYNLILLNESTLEEVFRVRTSRLSFSIILGTFTLVSFAILAALIFFTPLKHMLPGYNDVSVRDEVITEAQRIDSLEQVAISNNRQLLIIKNIIADNIDIDSIPDNIDSSDIDRWNKLPLSKGIYEEKFVKQYEEDNAYNLNSYMHNNNTNKAIIFAAPAYGTITKHFSPDKGVNGMTIVTSPNKPIISPQKGHIILVNYNANNGYTLVVQHDKGYLTIFRNIIQNLHPLGYEVKAGEAIAFANTLQFELWYNGIAINPEDYIVF